MSPVADLTVMTFNLRFDNPDDGPHAWAFREQRVIETVLAARPDLLATQEGMPAQLEALRHGLKGYKASLPGRPKDPHPRVQCPTIFFRHERLSLGTAGEFWLSETPHAYLSKSWGSAFPRMFTYARFQHRATGRRLWFGNTHLDHFSSRARLEGARLIRAWARRKRLPVILAGDFNDQPDSDVHGVFTGGPPALADSWRRAPGTRDDGWPTVHHFTGIPAGERIDWILVSRGIAVEEARIIPCEPGKVPPSDHFPYWIRVRIG
jgi:endonuclease/exonuclease/phosphatase family metal-dependent hydrolase